MIRNFAWVLVLSSGLCARTATAVDNWPQWRGPRATGVAAEGSYPIEFSSEKNVAWKVALPGPGSSTPAIWGDRIFVTCDIDEQDAVVCFDMEGQEQWRRVIGPGRAGKHRNASGSNPSPVTDGEHVVVYYKSGNVACFDFDGNEKWRHNVQEEFGEDTLWWDLGTSPVLADGKAVIAVMHASESYLVAYDLESGELAWRTVRDYENPQEADQAYTTPQVVKLDGREVIVAFGADHLTGHEGATGKLLWECGGFNPNNEGYWRVIASAAAGETFAVVPYGRGNFLAGIRLGGEGDVTATNRVWEMAEKGIGADVPTPVVAGDRFYLLGDAGELACRELATGEEIWTAALPRNRNRYYASPVLAGDLLYAAREDGTIFVGRVTEEGFKLLAENELGERIIATPVPIRDSLLIRSSEHLYSIKPKG